jgi:hypothetical protein
MPNRRRTSRVQAAIQQAATAYARSNGLRGSAAYQVSKVSGVALSSVQSILAGDSRHLANIEAVADALGLVIEVRAKPRLG